VRGTVPAMFRDSGPTQFPEGSPLSAVKRSATGISWLTLQDFGTQTGSGHGKAGLRGELGIMRRVTLVVGPSKVSIRRSGVGSGTLSGVFYHPRDN
jgi:hypothetical protein